MNNLNTMNTTNNVWDETFANFPDLAKIVKLSL